MGNARASTWDKREVEQPTSFRLTLITLNPGSWLQKGKGITMNTINGMSFYDSLTKLTMGFLLTWWLPSIITKEELKLSDFSTIQSCLYIVACFVAGCLWQSLGILCKKILLSITSKDSSENSDCYFECYLCSNMMKNKQKTFSMKLSCFIRDMIIFLFLENRNNEVMIYTAYNNFNEETIDRKKLLDKYYKAYYKAEMEGTTRNLPVLEAIEAFLRSLIWVIICYGVFFIFIHCSCWIETHNWIPGISFKKKFLGASITLFLLLFLWRSVQMKIYELVWEADKYLKEIEKEKDNK